MVTVKTISTMLTTQDYEFTLKFIATDAKGAASTATDVTVTVVKVNFAPEFGSKTSTVLQAVQEDITDDTALGNSINRLFMGVNRLFKGGKTAISQTTLC